MDAGGANPVSRALDSMEGTATTLTSRLRGSWGPRPSTTAVLLGSVLMLASLMIGLAVGGPVLGHEGRPEVALGAVAVFGASAFWLAKGWAGAARRTRWVAVALTLVIGASFTVGTLTNPVVVDGQVYLATSDEARSYRLIQQIRTDLLELAAADEYLTYNPAQAGAHFDKYPALLDRLNELSAKYATTGESQDMPDPRFATVIGHTTSAAYWSSRAVESKLEVIKADNARSQAALASNRASYAEAVILAGESLRELSVELDLPLTQMGPTE